MSYANTDPITGLYIHSEGKLKGQPTDFQDIPASLWWCIVTLTTVGYGDLTPRTTLGKIIASITMVTALVAVALPVTILSAVFSQESEEYLEVRTRKLLSEASGDLLFSNVCLSPQLKRAKVMFNRKAEKTSEGGLSCILSPESSLNIREELNSKINALERELEFLRKLKFVLETEVL